MFYHVRWKTIELYLACKPTKAFKREFRETGPRSDTHAPIPLPTPRLHDTERISFSVYMIPEWNFLPEREFHSEPKPESTQSRKDTMKFVKKQQQQQKTRIVRAFWLAERCVFAWKSVNMVVTSSCFSIRANHPSTNLKKWVENSTNLLYSPINSRSETLENLYKHAVSIVFRLNILSEKNPYFGKHLLL